MLNQSLRRRTGIETEYILLPARSLEPLKLAVQQLDRHEVTCTVCEPRAEDLPIRFQTQEIHRPGNICSQVFAIGMFQG